MSSRFTKMHGAGNDFVVLDGVRDALPPIEPLAARLCDRHLGIGADQLLVVRPGASADFRMEIWNADGSQVEMCANGIRAFYKYLRDHGHTDRAEISVETLSGVVRPRWAGSDRVTVDMGRPILAPAKIPTTLGAGDGPVLDVPLAVEGETLRVSSVSMGNPHAVIYVEDPGSDARRALGPRHRAPPRLPEPRQRRVRARDGPRPDRAADLGARRRGDARLRERCVRGRRGIHAARRGRSGGRASSCAGACSRSPGPRTTRTWR